MVRVNDFRIQIHYEERCGILIKIESRLLLPDSIQYATRRRLVYSWVKDYSREKEGKEGRGLIYMVRERGSCPTFTILPDLFDLGFEVFFLHRFTNLKRANRSIVIDGSMFWIAKTIRYRLWMFLQVFVLVTWFSSKISRMEKVKILWIMNIYLFIWYNRA